MTTYTESSVAPLTARDVIVRLKDASTPTPHTITLRAAEVTMTNAGFTAVRGMDENGDHFGATRKGPQNGVSTIAISGPISALGGETGETGLACLAMQDFSGLTEWTSTNTASDYPGGEFTLEVVWSPPTGITGVTDVYTKCVVAPGASLSKSAEGWSGSITIESQNAVPTRS